MARDVLHTVTSALTDRTTLFLFACLAAGWFLPSAVPILGYLLYPLFLPAYLVSMVTYDGLLGVEHVAYAVAEVLSVSGPVVFDAGLAATFYLFAVVAVVLGGALERRVGPEAGGDGGADENQRLGRFRDAVAAGLLLLGLLLVVQGVAAQPTVTSETCTGTSTAEEGEIGSTATTTCTTTTEPAPGARRYVLGLGAGIGTLGAGIVGVDHWLAGR
ncbi:MULTISPECIES: hypothetical protein [Halolamina]|uniref:Uncharacterized protein n=1 Tax=Halolamina pelagica TaxID=699431 RepID=A0A1I5UFR5_9EURY|nr:MULTISPECIES: hypothetical protein [Halolamina]NHX37252.1 hypothetical protein [Halolamina sp. R1-12]SFP93877.1 hypothetical protein SAMN05216277_11281 [Halolamina pelagica]